MHFGKTFVNSFCAVLIDVVDDVVNHFFVTGNRRRRNDDGVVVPQLNFGKFAVCYASERAHGFALAAGGEDKQIFVRFLVYHVYIDNHRIIQFKLAYFGCALDNVYHASAGKRHFTLELFGKVYYLLQAVNVGRESRNENSSVLILV